MSWNAEKMHCITNSVVNVLVIKVWQLDFYGGSYQQGLTRKNNFLRSGLASSSVIRDWYKV